MDAAGMPPGEADRVRRAGGAPGLLLSAAESSASATAARALVDAATGRQLAPRYLVALRQGSAGARGAFAETLGALTATLHEQLREAVARQDLARARGTCQAIIDVEDAKGRADGNANPQLVVAGLVRSMATALGDAR